MRANNVSGGAAGDLPTPYLFPYGNGGQARRACPPGGPPEAKNKNTAQESTPSRPRKSNAKTPCPAPTKGRKPTAPHGAAGRSGSSGRKPTAPFMPTDRPRPFAVSWGGWAIAKKPVSIPYLKRFTKSLKDHAFRILSWFNYQITTEPLEGLNNKIRVIKRKDYRFRNMDYVR